MTTPVRAQPVHALDAVVQAVDRLLDDFDVVDLLDELTQRCSQLLGVASVGLLLTDGTGALHLMSSTSGRTTEVELLQLQRDEGPCLECFDTGTAVLVPDLAAAAERWSTFAAVAADAGFASVHAVPMRTAGTVLGALGLFGTAPGPLAAADVTVAQTLAHIATVALLQQQPQPSEIVVNRLSTALANRTVVEQARGYLREALGVDIDTALRLLRQQARIDGAHLTDIARDVVVDTGRRHDLLAAMNHQLG